MDLQCSAAQQDLVLGKQSRAPGGMVALLLVLPAAAVSAAAAEEEAAAAVLAAVVGVDQVFRECLALLTRAR